MTDAMPNTTAPARPWSPRAERIAIAAFWSFLATLGILRRLVDPFRFAEQFGPMAYVHVAMYVVWAALTPLIFQLARRYPLEQGTNGRRLAGLAATGLGIAVAVELLSLTLVRALIDPAAMPPLPEGFEPPSFWPLMAVLRLWFLDELVIFLAVLAVGYARNFFIRLREREHEAASLQAQLADARLAALRMQLNPHFLFNTLNSISSLADSDPEGVQRIVARLSALLRRTLEGADRQEVPLSQELSFLHDYLEIQRVRFDERLEVTEEIERATLGALVPNLILQPLVENAIKHGADRASGGTARIELRARREAERLVLSVRDNGPGLAEGAVEQAAHAGRVGLTNTRARLDALYGDAASLDLTDAPGGGLLATVTLPLHAANGRPTAHA